MDGKEEGLDYNMHWIFIVYSQIILIPILYLYLLKLVRIQEENKRILKRAGLYARLTRGRRR